MATKKQAGKRKPAAPVPAAERHREYRANMTAQGFRQISAWVHEDDRERVAAYLEKVRRAKDRA